MSSLDSVNNKTFVNQVVNTNTAKVEARKEDSNKILNSLALNTADTAQIKTPDSKTKVIESLSLVETTSDHLYNSKSANYKEWYTPQYQDYDKKYGSFHYSGISLGDNSKVLKNPSSVSKEVLEQNQSWRTAYSSCGPASALMTLKANGFGEDLSIAGIRSIMKVPPRGAVSSESISNVIEKVSNKKLDAEINNAKAKETPEAFLNRMKKEIKDDNMVILLTQFMDEDPTNEVSNAGHYVIVNGFKGNDLLVINPFILNEEQQIPFEEFKEAFLHRKELGAQPNAFIAVSDDQT